jgi:hypothetical protein
MSYIPEGTKEVTLKYTLGVGLVDENFAFIHNTVTRRMYARMIN